MILYYTNSIYVFTTAAATAKAAAAAATAFEEEEEERGVSKEVTAAIISRQPLLPLPSSLNFTQLPMFHFHPSFFYSLFVTNFVTVVENISHPVG